MAMTKRQLTRKIDNLLRNEADLLCYLFDRWQDEHEYEEWKVYEKAMKELVLKHHQDATFIKATEDPFGAVFTLDNWKIQIHATLTSVGSNFHRKKIREDANSGM